LHAISICARIPQNAVNHAWFDYMFTRTLAIIPKRMCDYVFGDWLSMHAWLWSSFCRGPEQGSAERACVEYIFTRARAIIQTRMCEYVCGSGSVCMHCVCVFVCWCSFCPGQSRVLLNALVLNIFADGHAQLYKRACLIRCVALGRECMHFGVYFNDHFAEGQSRVLLNTLVLTSFVHTHTFIKPCMFDYVCWQGFC
jgi:hypothetical protein